MATRDTVRNPSPDRSPEEDGPPEETPRAYAAEFLGTFFLVGFICLFLTVGLKVVQPEAAGFSLAALGLLHAFVLATAIYVFGNISQAHFNPAVTVALLAMRKIAPRHAAGYILAQLGGALLGALVCRILLVEEGEITAYGATRVTQATTVAGALLAEFIGTFVLMTAIMGMAISPRGDDRFAGLIIGLALGFAAMVFGPLTGAGFNPARSFGPAVVSGEFPNFWIYLVGPLLGALAAAFTYRALDSAAAGEERPGDYG